ncbi:TIGR04282 family arsenosugar biosynthesis glycosyltransferase [Sulfuricystis multivorans]|uniref:TIGR04282 family arsenosugar biosynthesis glycosyltransferase n=1 Tax=Sulfuricystis multivorans TaxID=2211108 RepID=UPI0024E01C76|nr:TIGR04282 family arsenosugar biosynthesis glycosyltransferase [Sulfuricystis multivorans]
MSPIDPDAGRVGVAILARAPIPGQCKTRLIPALGAAGAARLQRWLLQRTVAMALVADVGPVSLWCAGDPRHPDFIQCRAYGAVSVRHQPQGDLGRRMLAAAHASATSSGVLVIGTDCPALTPGSLREAAARLQRHDAVLTPAEDGGYVLIGLRAPIASVFEGIAWGSDEVMAQTRQRLRECGCTWEESTTLWDVDRPEDLSRLLAAFPEAMQAIGTAVTL